MSIELLTKEDSFEFSQDNLNLVLNYKYIEGSKFINNNELLLAGKANGFLFMEKFNEDVLSSFMVVGNTSGKTIKEMEESYIKKNKEGDVKVITIDDQSALFDSLTDVETEDGSTVKSDGYTKVSLIPGTNLMSIITIGTLGREKDPYSEILRSIVDYTRVEVK